MEEDKSPTSRKIPVEIKEEPDSPHIDWNSTKTAVEFDKDEETQYPVDEKCLNLYWLDAYEN